MNPVGSLIYEMELNLSAHMSFFQRRIDGMEVLDIGVMLLINSGIVSDSYNVVCDTRLPNNREVAQKSIAFARDYFAARNLPMTWWVGPLATPSRLGEMLINTGFTREGDDEPGMCFNLSQPLPQLDPSDHFHIVETSSLHAIQQFSDIVAQSCSPPDEGVRCFWNTAAQSLISEAAASPCHLFVGYQDDLPVTSAEIFVTGGIAGIYNLATLAAYRRRGMAKAMMVTMLHHARQLGCSYAMLQASPEGVGLYRQLGFQTIGFYNEYKPSK